MMSWSSLFASAHSRNNEPRSALPRVYFIPRQARNKIGGRAVPSRSPSPYFPLSAPLLKGRLRDAHSGSWCVRAGEVQPTRETVGGNLWNGVSALLWAVAGLICLCSALGGGKPPTYEWTYLVCTRYNLQNHNIKFVNNYPINPSTQNRI